VLALEVGTVEVNKPGARRSNRTSLVAAMQERFINRHRKPVGRFLFVLAVVTCLYAAIVVVNEGFESAVPPILVACLFCFNCVGFFFGWFFSDAREPQK
jgi:hypothetical protein